MMKHGTRLVPLFLFAFGCNWPFPVDRLPGDLPEPEQPAPEPGACLFGDTFYALRHEDPPSHSLTLSPHEWIRADADITEPVERAQLVLAVQQSSHVDVTTVAEALDRVDQNEVRRIWITTEDGDTTYVAYEYGAGDNSYGAFFAQGELPVLAQIHDGDIMSCIAFE